VGRAGRFPRGRPPLISTSIIGVFGLSVWTRILPLNGPLPSSGFRVSRTWYSRPAVMGSICASIPLTSLSILVTLIDSVAKLRTRSRLTRGSLSSILPRSATGGVTAMTGRTKPETGICTSFASGGWYGPSRCW